MRVLLVNPNTYKSPPTPPIGLEYIASSLRDNGYETGILDLCFSSDIAGDMAREVSSFRPDIAGVTVRNVDTCLYHTNEFFLDAIAEIVGRLKSVHRLPVVVGGAGVRTNPSAVLEYLGADYLIAGPGEETFPELLKQMGTNGHTSRIFRGRCGKTEGCRTRGIGIDYGSYLNAGGIGGFETHKGCSSSCVYCLESNTRVSFRNVGDVVAEVRFLVDAGCDHFHLCDSEFNEDLDYSTAFCTSLKKAGLGIKWSLYMKPANFNRALFRLLKETGVYLVTLTMDSWKKCTQYWQDYEKFIFNARANGIRVAVDFLTGFPRETVAEIESCLDTLRRPMPESIGVNTYLRLYRSLKITDLIMRDETLKPHLLGCTDDPRLLKPVFYNHIDTEQLGNIIGGDPLFRIEGIEKGVNYLRQ